MFSGSPAARKTCDIGRVFANSTHVFRGSPAAPETCEKRAIFKWVFANKTCVLFANIRSMLRSFRARGGFKLNFPFSKSTPKIFGRLRRPKSTFMNIIDSLLSLFWISPPQAGKFWGFGLVSHVFLLFFKGKSIKTQPKTPKIFRPSGPDLELNPPLFSNRRKQGGV